MRSFPFSLLVPTIALALAGCGRADREPPVPAATLTPSAAAAMPSPSTPAPVASAGPTSGTAQPSGDPTWNEPTDPADPRSLIVRWRAAMETRDFRTAHALFGDRGSASGMSATSFAAAWDKYRVIDITVGKGQQEGAAGSLYYEAPVTITGLKRDGEPYHLAGTITLRRVNDVDGATPEQLAWHIERSTLKP